MDFEIRYANNLDVLIAIYVDEELPNGGTTIARRTFAIPIPFIRHLSLFLLVKFFKYCICMMFYGLGAA